VCSTVVRETPVHPVDTQGLFEQMLAPGDSRLCEKKDVILGKFDQLLRKLGGEELSLNISLGKMGEEWHAAMEGWLDAESTYRLRIEQVPPVAALPSCTPRGVVQDTSAFCRRSRPAVCARERCEGSKRRCAVAPLALNTPIRHGPN